MSEQDPRRRLVELFRLALRDANARTRRLEAEAFERMRFPANMGWFQGDTEPVEVVYYVTRDGEVVRLIADQDEPWVYLPEPLRLAEPKTETETETGMETEEEPYGEKE